MTDRRRLPILRALAAFPEIPLAASGFALNAVWEFTHSPLYADHGNGFGYVVWTRLHCTGGDVLILLCAFWVTAMVTRSRRWFEVRLRTGAVIFVLSGLGYTIFSEWVNVYGRETWAYAAAMPLVFGIGVSPIVQWTVIPPLIVVILRRVPRTLTAG